MASIPSRWRRVLAVTAWTFSSFLPGLVVAQAPTPPPLGYAEVSGNDVYVRSGASANHYPVCKLDAGTKVTVLSERGDWFEITPPQGVFSYISGDFVDTTDNRTGVVNGNRVNVRAGSSIAEYAAQKYAVQTQLERGTTVNIIERQADGFLKIEPPTGATVWISRQFLDLVPNTEARATAPAGDVATLTDEPSTTPVMGTPEQGSQPTTTLADAPKKPTFHGLPLTDQRSELMTIDEDARTEFEKPVVERSFTALIDRYQTVAEQEEDDFAQRYARTRIEQLTHMSKLAEKVRSLRDLGNDVDAKRQRFLEERAKIGGDLPAIPDGLEVQGELRVSSLYPRTRRPQRFRLVRTIGENERTIAYIEIPNDVSIDVDNFLGRYVGVRASARRLQSGGVDPVPIYIAEQLVHLQPNETEDTNSVGG